MMLQFNVYKTVHGPALFVVDTSRYDGFWGFNRLVRYLPR
jgi:hypothetical protein